MNPWIAQTLSVAAGLAVAGAALAGLAIAGSNVTAAQSHPPYAPLDRATSPTHAAPSAAALKVAVVLGASGTVATDALGPYEVFSRSSAFFVYTVAAQAGPVAVDGAPSILPDYTFGDVDARPDLHPDVVVVPALDDPDGASEATLRSWVVAQAGRGAHVLGVCAGSRVLAAAGLLDGMTATSHWSRLAELRKSHPETTWVDGRRYVQDGRVTTTAGITSGIPGALAVVNELAGPAAATTVGAQVGYPGWSIDASTTIPVQSFDLSDRPVVFNAAMPWFRPTVGVALTDGVSEIDAASAFEVYDASGAARTVAITPGGSITTRHGLVLLGLPTDQVTDVDRVVQPGATTRGDLDPAVSAWASARGIQVEPMTGPHGRAGFDGALEYLAHDSGADTARSAAKMVDYPTDQLDLGSESSSLRTWLLFAGVVALATLAGWVTYRLLTSVLH
jgi:putative intracellular protease/amidase